MTVVHVMVPHTGMVLGVHRPLGLHDCVAVENSVARVVRQKSVVAPGVSLRTVAALLRAQPAAGAFSAQGGPVRAQGVWTQMTSGKRVQLADTVAHQAQFAPETVRTRPAGDTDPVSPVGESPDGSRWDQMRPDGTR